jgi:hypothetical protein
MHTPAFFIHIVLCNVVHTTHGNELHGHAGVIHSRIQRGSATPTAIAAVLLSTARCCQLLDAMAVAAVAVCAAAIARAIIPNIAFI